ncbi:MAG: pilin [Archangium sp.]
MPLNPQQAPQPAKKSMPVAVIILIVLGVVCCPIGGLAAIAVPNFIRFQARSKQSECKMNLKSAFIAQKSYFGEKDTYGEDPTEIGFSPEKGTRYLYVLGPGSEIAPSNATAKTPVGQLRAAIPSDVVPGVEGECPEKCNATVVCVGNIDNDDTIDVWSISTENRTFNGESVPAGMPFNHVNDVAD